MPELHIPLPVIKDHLQRYILEDVVPLDLTAGLVPACLVEAQIIAKASGILAGVLFVQELFAILGNVKTSNVMPEGTHVAPGMEVLHLEGDSRSLLSGERLALNLLMKMSGIATLTNRFIEIAQRGVESPHFGSRVRIAATRKTTPGFRLFEKYAVAIGGGDTHRWDLGDAVLLKNNHITLFRSIENAIAAAKSRSPFTSKIEIEVRTRDEAVRAAQAGADIVMLDNFTAKQMEDAVGAITAAGLREEVVIEASGNVTLETIEEIAKTGVDVVSVGMLTHSAPSLDFSMKILQP